MRAEPFDIGPYLHVLRGARPVWMDGDELGMAVGLIQRDDGGYPIQLWPYAHGKRVSDVANTVTEEVAHYVPGNREALADDTDDPHQKAVMRQLARRLMQDVRWQAAVYRWIAQAYHWSLRDLKKTRKVTIG